VANDDLAQQTAEVILLCRDANDNAHVATQLSAENYYRFDALNQAAVIAVCMVAPTGTTVEQCLRALPVQVMEVTNYDIHQGAAGALATAQLRHGGLRGLEPGFPPRSSFRDREDLIVYFQSTAAVVMYVPDIILNVPLE